MLIRSFNGVFYKINDFIAITKIDEQIEEQIAGILSYGIQLEAIVNNNNIFYKIYKSNSEEERDKVIGKIWDSIKFGDNIIDVKTIVDSLNT